MKRLAHNSGLVELLGAVISAGLLSLLIIELFPEESGPGGAHDLVYLVWLLLFLLLGGRYCVAALSCGREIDRLQRSVEEHAAGCERRLEHALKSHEGFYQQVLEDLPEMVCRWLPDGRITYVNDAYCRYFGEERDALLHGGKLPAFHPGAAGVAIDSAPYRDKPVVTVEFPVPQESGEVRWQRWTDRALFDERGEIREFQSIGEDITARKHTEEETQRLLQENRRLARMVMAIQEEERARLARELHDELGQALTAVRADAQCILRHNRERDRPIGDCARAIDAVAGQVYGTVRDMMRRLRPALLDDLGLCDALNELVDKFSVQHPEIVFDTKLEKTETAIPKEVELAAFRTVQEALTNIVKHAHATTVSVSLQRGGDILYVAIIDNGIGMDTAEESQGYGLLGMRERALSLGGAFELNTAPGEGVRIWVTLPLQDRGEENGQ